MRTRSLVCVAAVTSLSLAFGRDARADSCGTYAWDNPSTTYPEGVEHHVFHSASMNVDVGFNVYTPPGYAAGSGQLPTIYFLHGVNGTEWTMVPNVVPWVASRVAKGLMRPAILVFANGAINSAYADAKDGSRRVETTILKELVPYVDAHWRTYACREQRSISGFSMGGNGALMYAFKHADLFGSVVGYAGALLDWQTLSAQHPDTATCMFGDDASHFDQYSPWYWVQQRAVTLKSSLRIRMIVGDQDALLPANQTMDSQLTALGIKHEFEVVPGCKHEHGCLWTTAGDHGVAFHEAAFAACGSSPVDADAGGGTTTTTTDAGATGPTRPPPSQVGAADAEGDGGGEAGAPAVVSSGGCSAAGGMGGAPQGLLGLVLLMMVRARAGRGGRTQAAARRGGVVAGAVLATTLAGLVACSSTASDPPFEAATSDDAGPPPPGTATDGGAPVITDATTSPEGEAAAPPPASVTCSALQVSGDPASAQGATWAYHATDDGVEYDLTGTLLRPSGSGPFPAVVVSHGLGGSASSYAKSIGLSMRTWGLVAIATNYTHGTTPDGLPTGPFGASSANILRARKARGLLACLTYVDGKRVAAHGHSMGALLTGMLVGMYGSEFVAASHTAGGVSDTGTVNDGIATTTVAVAMAITVPYQLHHGDSDDVVPLAMDQKLDGILTASGIPHELHVYAGYEHPQVALDALMLTRVRAWYTAHGL